jgi:hypothetical protein
MARPLAAVVIFVDDVARMAAFYRSLADMTPVQADAQHAVLEIPGLQLTIHALRPARDGRPASYPTREDSHVKPCLPIENIARARAIATQLGGELWPANKEWDAVDRGFRACDGRDPEGNVFQVRQPL